MNKNSYERTDWIFNDEVREKKRIANQARYRKCGSKSKKCNFSTDHMTNKQWKERCGETVTCNLNEPILWQDFCELPTHIQKSYLLHLIEQYSTTASDLAKMFGINPQTVTRHCNAEGIGIRFSPGKRMTRANREAFGVFCGWFDEEPTNTTVLVQKEEPKPAAVSPAKTEAPVAFNDAAPSQDMAMTEFTLSFSGNFNREMIYNSIASILPKGTPVKLDIKCVVTP